MIRILVKGKNNIINEIEIKGHAGYDDKGKDIVCAGVSSTVITTVNGILAINKDAITHHLNNDDLRVVINQHDDIVDKLINNMLKMLKEIEKEYKKYIQINEEV